MKKVISILLVAVMCVFLLAGCGEKDHNDGKCDICDKKSTYSDGEEEYCDKHLADAVKWYIEQGKD